MGELLPMLFLDRETILMNAEQENLPWPMPGSGLKFVVLTLFSAAGVIINAKEGTHKEYRFFGGHKSCGNHSGKLTLVRFAKAQALNL